ncbi:MAG: response regulator transcription factor [Armatimonadota bacterium]
MGMKNTKRLLLVDDHQMFREMLEHMLSAQKDMEVVGTAGTIAEAIEKIEKTCPDVITIDVLMPDGSGIELAQSLKTSYPGIAIVFLTACRNEETIIQAMRAGVAGYVIKSSSSEQLLDAIRTVCSGEYVFYPALSMSIFQQFATALRSTEMADTNYSGKLSKRETEIAGLISQGLTYREIAEATCVSINTVKTHVRRIYERLGISSRRDL